MNQTKTHSATGESTAAALDERLLSREYCEALWQRVRALARGGGRTAISVASHWNGEMRWARNQVHLASDRRSVALIIQRAIGGASGRAATNQLDDASVEATIRRCEDEANRMKSTRPRDMLVSAKSRATPAPLIWSEATFTAAAGVRAKLAQSLSRSAQVRGLLSSGYLEVRGATQARVGGGIVGSFGVWREEEYDPAQHEVMSYSQMTQAQCSMTVRHPKGTGSGWAGLSSFDWAQLDCAALAERALEKCVASLNPVRIEPGRYTVILEPQAVLGLVNHIMGNDMIHRPDPERGTGPWVLGPDEALGIWRSKLGLKVVDERITISHDPMDPQLGVVPEPGLAPLTVIDRGVLKSLVQSYHDQVRTIKEEAAPLFRPAYRMSGGTTSMEEMISTTKRGLIVTRFSNLAVLNENIPLLTGVTRDGLWLVENGTITKAVNNMRITESPLFVLNQIEQIGVPVPVFRPEQNWQKTAITPAIVPPLKANDFSFTATIDAV